MWNSLKDFHRSPKYQTSSESVVGAAGIHPDGHDEGNEHFPPICEHAEIE